MIDETTLRGLDAAVSAQRAIERAEPELERHTGAIRKLWQEHCPQQAFPPQIAALDEAVPLTASEAASIILVASHSYNAGFRAARDATHKSMVDSVVFLAAEGFYLHLQGLWIAMHRAGIPLDHEGVAARLLDTHGPAVSATYAHEATIGAALIASGGAPVSFPPIERVH